VFNPIAEQLCRAIGNRAARFVISSTNDFTLAREMIKRNPSLKEPPGYKLS